MKVSELLNNSSCWAQGSFAYDSNGDKCSSFELRATCWCMLGAINKCYEGDEAVKVVAKVNEAIKKRITVPRGLSAIPYFNDNKSYEDVIELVKELDI